jgi:hypothetical protein
MEYPTQYYKDLNDGFHILYVEAIENIFLDDKRRDRYIELQNIRSSYENYEFKDTLHLLLEMKQIKHPFLMKCINKYLSFDN